MGTECGGAATELKKIAASTLGKMRGCLAADKGTWFAGCMDQVYCLGGE